MKKIILINLILFFLIHCTGIAQQNWNFSFNIQKNNFYELSGKINEKYPIKMFLEQDTFVCGNPYDDDINLTLKGWYYYEKIKTRIQLKGSYNKTEGREYVELFVPVNTKDKLNNETCKLKDYTEVFANKNAFDLTNLTWKVKASKTYSKVKLNLNHDSGPETKLTLVFKNNGKTINEFNITELSGARYLDEYKLFDTKKIDNFYYATFEFQEWSRQDDNANAMCGAGIERYLGYIKIDNTGKLIDYKICLRESCWTYDKVEELMIVPGHPEYGLVKSD